jgi:hypothetical protein
MERKELKDLLVAAAKNKGIATFSATDVQSAATNALVEHFGFKDASFRDIRSQKEAVFAVIEEVIDEVVPMMVMDRTGDFAEVQTFPRNASIMYKVPMAEQSRRRMYKAIKPGARGGIYKAFRLDGFTITVQPEIHTVGYAITLEELLTGQRTIQELVTVITDAWMEKIYEKVFLALNTAAEAAPAANQVVAGTGLEIVNEQLDKLISISRAYGNPVILGFPAQLRLLANVPGTITGYANPADLDDIRNRGYIGIYKGVPLVELPNYILSHKQSGPLEWLFQEDKLFVVPAGVRPVKVAFQGESHLEEVKQPTGGSEYHNHRIFAVTVLFKNHICTYQSLEESGINSFAGGADGLTVGN